jgi:hypothetical protein
MSEVTSADPPFIWLLHSEVTEFRKTAANIICNALSLELLEMF